MSNKRPHRNRNNRPQPVPLTYIGIAGDRAMFVCRECGELHIHHLPPELIQALEAENEEGSERQTRTPHDTSLLRTTESNNDHDI